MEDVIEESFPLNIQKEFNKQKKSVALSQQMLKIVSEQKELKTNLELQKMSINELDQVKKSNIEGYDLYVWKGIEIAKRLNKEKNKYYSLWRLGCSSFPKDVEELVERNLSQVHINQFNRYCGAGNNKEEVEEEIRLIELRIEENDDEAKIYVKEQLINNAWMYRSMLTDIWFGLLGIIFIGTIIGLIQLRKRSKNQP